MHNRIEVLVIYVAIVFVLHVVLRMRLVQSQRIVAVLVVLPLIVHCSYILNAAGHHSSQLRLTLCLKTSLLTSW